MLTTLSSLGGIIATLSISGSEVPQRLSEGRAVRRRPDERELDQHERPSAHLIRQEWDVRQLEHPAE